MSDEIERRVHLLESAARRAGSDVALNGATFEPVGEARTALLTAIAALRAERDALQVHLRAAEEAAGHSEFLSSPLYSTVARIVAERDAAQAEVARLREALEHLIERADTSDDCQYGTLSTSYVRDIARAALESKT